MKKAFVGILFGTWAISGQAQQLETDYSKYLSPIVFNDAARFWVFAPGLTKDCAPGPRAGRIGLEYEMQMGRAWIELAHLEGAKSARPKFTIATQATDISYPRYEQTRGISEGKVTVSMKLMADGSTSGHAIFFAVPRSKGFMETALRAAKQLTAKFDEPLDKPFACTLITYTFKLV